MYGRNTASNVGFYFRTICLRAFQREGYPLRSNTHNRGLGPRAFRLVRGPGPSGFPDCPVAFVLGVRALGIGGWDVISIGASAAFALPSHWGQVTLAMSTVSSSCGAWAPQTARPLLVSFSSRLPSLVEYDQCR